MKAPLPLLGLLLFCGCAQVQTAKFDPWRGMDPQESSDSAQGIFEGSPEKVGNLVVDALQHDPYMEWMVSHMDLKAGQLEFNNGDTLLKITLAPQAGDKCKLSAAFQPGPPSFEHTFWVNDKDTRKVSPYGLGFTERTGWHDQSAQVVLDEAYVLSLVKRRSQDRSNVPFSLETPAEGQ